MRQQDPDKHCRGSFPSFFFLPSIPVHTPELFSQTDSATHSTSGARRSLHPGQTRTRPTQVRKVYTSSEAEGVTTPQQTDSATQSTSGARRSLHPGQTRTRPTQVRKVYTSSEAEGVTTPQQTDSATQSTSGATLPPGQTRTRPTGQARERTNRVREVYTSSEAEGDIRGRDGGETKENNVRTAYTVQCLNLSPSAALSRSRRFS